MAPFSDYLYPLNEAHVRLHYDGETVHLDGLPAGPDSVSLPELYRRGVQALFNLLESMVPDITCVSLLGIWFAQQPSAPFIAFDIWIQRDSEGFYLPMSSSASLFRENGIPYFHKPSL